MAHSPNGNFGAGLLTERRAAGAIRRMIAVVACVSVVDCARAQHSALEANRWSWTFGNSAQSIVGADLDGDGDVDFAHVSTGGSGVSVQRNLGDGVFSGPSFHAMGALGTHGVDAADLDADGDEDLVVGDWFGGAIAVLRNLGSGVFGPATTYTVQNVGSPFAIAHGDLDGDGDLDLVVSMIQAFSGGIGVLLNQGNGMFGAAIAYPAAGARMEAVVRDLDGDGDLDIAASSFLGNSVAVLFNDGLAHFSAPTSWTGASGMFGITAADLDGDGDVDLATPNRDTSSINVFQNAGDGTYAVHTSYVALSPTGIVARDLDGDGDVDLAAGAYPADLDGACATLLRNDGAGNFVVSTSRPMAPSLSLASADLDGDGDQDLVNGAFLGGLETLYNHGDGSFGSAPSYDIGGRAVDVVSADFDGDGRADIAAADGEHDRIAVSLNAGDGSLSFTNSFAAGPDLRALAAGDVDADGDVDLVAASSASGAAALYLNASNGTFAPPVAVQVGAAASDVLLADMDQDLDLDLVFGGSGRFSVLFNSGSGLFGPPFSTIDLIGALRIAVADLDGDLQPDVVTTGDESLRVYASLGGGQFAAPIPFSGGFGTTIALLDLDDDGDVDIATERYGALVFVRNSGAGTFTPDNGGPYLATSLEVAASDVDVDGDLDLLVGDRIGWNLSVFENQAGGSFVLQGQYANWGRCRAIVAADLDGDRDPEIVTVQDSSHALTVLRNVLVTGSAFCLGDGGTTSCPCGNDSAIGLRAGCVNSLASAGTLRGSGAARIAHDELVLRASGLPNSVTLFFQGASPLAGPVVFGDGLRCLGGTLHRLGTKPIVANAAAYPGASDPPISAVGDVRVPGERSYQAWYRDPNAFCVSSTFNLTNGWRVVWSL